MSDDLRGYVQLVAGLTDVTRQRARDVAQGLLATSGSAVPPGAGAVAGQVAGLAEDIVTAARQNRGLLLDIVRGEVERSVHSLGLATPSEVLALREQVASLERRLADAESRVPSPAAMPPHTDTERVAVPRRTRKATAGSATAKTTAKKTTKTTAAGTRTAAKRTAVKATPKKATEKRTPEGTATPATTTVTAPTSPTSPASTSATSGTPVPTPTAPPAPSVPGT